MQRSTSINLSDVRFSSAIDQHPHYRPSTPKTRPIQRSRSSFFSDIETSSAIDQHRHYKPIGQSVVGR
jgi:hypothetical protein